MPKKIAANVNKQLGQTLIETVVAIFILVMGVTSALALGVYSFQSVGAASLQVLGTSLARQQVEAIRNIRDANWLSASDPIQDCSSIYGGAPNVLTQQCHMGWLGSGNKALAQGSFELVFNSFDGSWSLVSVPQNNGNPQTYNLKFDPATNLYTTSGQTASIYYGRVDISYSNQSPFNIPNNPQQIIVTSTVWWTNRKCPVVSNPVAANLPASCVATIVQHLTNWRDY